MRISIKEHTLNLLWAISVIISLYNNPSYAQALDYSDLTLKESIFQASSKNRNNRISPEESFLNPAQTYNTDITIVSKVENFVYKSLTLSTNSEFGKIASIDCDKNYFIGISVLPITIFPSRRFPANITMSFKHNDFNNFINTYLLLNQIDIFTTGVNFGNNVVLNERFCLNINIGFEYVINKLKSEIIIGSNPTNEKNTFQGLRFKYHFDFLKFTLDEIKPRRPSYNSHNIFAILFEVFMLPLYIIIYPMELVAKSFTFGIDGYFDNNFGTFDVNSLSGSSWNIAPYIGWSLRYVQFNIGMPFGESRIGYPSPDQSGFYYRYSKGIEYSLRLSYAF
ncbi:MAG: hypothetical protein ABIH86_00560 [Planctomycetota bacterium]